MTFEETLQQIVRDAVRVELAKLADNPLRNGDESYLSIAKAARVADVAPGTIRAWIRNGRLACKRAGRVLRVGRSELDRFLSGVPSQSRAADIKQRVARRIEADRKALRGRAA